MSWRIVGLEEGESFVQSYGLKERKDAKLKKAEIIKNAKDKGVKLNPDDLQIEFYTSRDYYPEWVKLYSLEFYGTKLCTASPIYEIEKTIAEVEKRSGIKVSRLDIKELKGLHRVERHYDDATQKYLMSICVHTTEGECLWFKNTKEAKRVCKDKVIRIKKLMKTKSGKSLEKQTITRMRFSPNGFAFNADNRKTAFSDYSYISGNNNNVVSISDNGYKTNEKPILMNEFCLFGSVLPKVKEEKGDAMSDIGRSILRDRATDLDIGSLYVVAKNLYLEGNEYCDIRRHLKSMVRQEKKNINGRVVVSHSQISNKQIKSLVDRVFG